MSERNIDKRRLIVITASAALGLGITALALARSHANDGDIVHIETDSPDELRARAHDLVPIEPSVDAIEADVVIVGPSDKKRDLTDAKQVHAIGLNHKKRFAKKILERGGDLYYDFRNRK